MKQFLATAEWTGALATAALLVLGSGSVSAAEAPAGWQREFPKADFSVSAVPFEEIRSGGPPRDGIPPIDDPVFVPIAEAELDDREPVIGLILHDEAKAYPLRVLTWHEIANDMIGQGDVRTPVAVTYCPLCNAAIVFDRRVTGPDGEERVLDFGTTGRLRHSDLVMYDRQTESWWQQFTGEAIVGSLTGADLDTIPARLESFAAFRERAGPDAQVLVPNDPDFRPYGANPYVGYDSAAFPFLFEGEVPAGIAPMDYVVRVGEEAWALDLLREAGRIETDDLVLTWAPGQASALDTRAIAEGRDIGQVTVQEKLLGPLRRDTGYDVTFAFVFFAFQPDGVLHTANGEVSMAQQDR